MTLPTFVTLLGKVELGDHRPSERTRFSEKLYPEACFHRISVCLGRCAPSAMKELRLTFGEAAEVMAGLSGSQRGGHWQDNRTGMMDGTPSSFLLLMHTHLLPVSLAVVLYCFRWTERGQRAICHASGTGGSLSRRRGGDRHQAAAAEGRHGRASTELPQNSSNSLHSLRSHSYTKHITAQLRHILPAASLRESPRSQPPKRLRRAPDLIIRRCQLVVPTEEVCRWSSSAAFVTRYFLYG